MSEEEMDNLDHAVAAVLGGSLDGDGWRFDPPLLMQGERFSFIKTKRSFCRDWYYGGPVIEAMRITLASPHDDAPPDRMWQAVTCKGSDIHFGPTALIAGMLAVASMAR